MHIVILDGYVLNPGDLSWEGFQALGDCAIHDRTAPAELVDRCRGAQAAITNKVVLDAEVIEQLPALRYIGVTATGYNCVDTAAAERRGIAVTNVPAYSTDSVVQMVFAHLMNLTLRVGYHAHTVKHQRWANSPDFAYWHYPLVEVAGRTMGIVGFGQIGQAVARVAQAFGMQVIVYSPRGSKGVPGVEAVGLDECFRRADVLTLHCPLTADTARLVNADRLALMKPTAFLLNTSRGGVIDEPALAEALATGRIAGAGLDVLTEEPPPADHPLVPLKNCHITPHIAWATQEARRRLMQVAVANLQAYLAGKPHNVVNQPRGNASP